jgi:uncharacterized protein
LRDLSEKSAHHHRSIEPKMIQHLNITSLTLAALALLLTALSLNVSRLRMRYRATYGDAGHKDLMVAVRAHGNSLEQSLLFIALLGAVEWMAGLGANTLTATAALFVAARLLYAAAVFTRRLSLRQIAHSASVLLQVALALVILVQTMHT